MKINLHTNNRVVLKLSFARYTHSYYYCYNKECFNDSGRQDLGEFFIWNAPESVQRLDRQASSDNEKTIGVAFELEKEN